MNRSKEDCKRKINPTVDASFLSKWTFWWLKDIFKTGLKRPITSEDLYQNVAGLDSEMLTNKLEVYWEEEKTRERPSFIRTVCRAYVITSFIIGVFYTMAVVSLRVIQPMCLGGLVSYFVKGQTTTSRTEAWIYACGIIVSSFLIAVMFHSFVLYGYMAGTKVRLSASGLVYRKILKMSTAEANEGMSGRAINILSNDVEKFDSALQFFHDLYKGPIEAVVFGYLMYREIGISAVIGVLFLLSFLPLQSWAGKKASHYRQQTAKRTDYRVKLMNEVIQGIQVIKMYAWEKSFAAVIADARRREINAVRGTNYVQACLQSISMVSKMALFMALVSYVYFGEILTASKVFVVTSYFNSLNESMVRLWSRGLICTAEALVSANRVEAFLLDSEAAEEDESMIMKNIASSMMESRKSIQSNLSIVQLSKVRRLYNPDSMKRGIVLQNASASMKNDDNYILKGFDMTITAEETVAIIGPVGSGKSSLLNVLIGELELDDGYVIINGRISYASQEVWLFEGSVRDNIVFVEDFDPVRYREVIHVCALERDLELLPQGDLTIVGERGISLSGGQKARINLARAIYKKADIYLLDDPLSAVDAAVCRHIFDKCVREYLHDKICLLVTHQIQLLKDMEHVILINSGRMEAQGSYQNLQCLPGLEYLREMSSDSVDEGRETEVIKKRKTLKRNSETDSEDRKEQLATGSVDWRVYKGYFKALEGLWILIVNLVLFVLVRCLLSSLDIFLSGWATWEENVTLLIQTWTRNGTGILREYQITIDHQREVYILTYAILLGCTFVFFLTRTFTFFTSCLRISSNLHNYLFRGVTRATMWFFNTNPSGRILNRFSRDIHIIDTTLPNSLFICGMFVLDIASVLTIVAMNNYILLFPAFVIGILFYLLRHLYVNSSRSLKRIESMARSPVYSHTNQTFQGLTTIRAFNAEAIIEKEYHNFQNFNSSAWYLFINATRAFGLWLDFICVLYILIVTFSFFMFGDDFDSGNVGLVIMQCLRLTGLCQFGIRQTAELENQMTSVERVVEYSELPSEPALESLDKYKPPENWPQYGRIKFTDVGLKYSDKGAWVLKNLNFTIEPKEKVGIVGRTGAGKSSIIQSIFRLAVIEGTIEIDEIDTSTLGLHDLRSKISIIPQDPILFSGTLRYNLDPFEEKTDFEVWQALEAVELKNHAMSLAGGLDSKMSDGGANFSMGQRQLVCLARAILRNNKILILDEATANVDPETDQLIQNTIRKNFTDCTVLTIAHRLHTVMDSDKIIAMDAGRIVEIGHPTDLLLQNNGYFRNLVEKTGTNVADLLSELTTKANNLRNVD